MGSSAGDPAPTATPIAATFPIEQIRDAVTLQSGGHVHGKVVVTL